MKFELRPANSLTGPRVYSTDFNPRALGRGANELVISRSLKIKLLTKGVVTINGGQALKKLSPKNEAKILTGLREMRAISAEYQRPF
ncbi:hypothetical protein [Mesorhizobium sp. SP-1A]|uniref:hypothetical protein n=1 Tax=Mesorhizobium sp. SP-1A TaxID=3077840 RepID=UPI0028F6FD93|nr:hypothetical protein [Mesorhizobium sp. SP-1A]